MHAPRRSISCCFYSASFKADGVRKLFIVQYSLMETIFYVRLWYYPAGAMVKDMNQPFTFLFRVDSEIIPSKIY